MITIFIYHGFSMLFQRIGKHGITMVFHMYHNHTMVLHSITIVHVRKHGNTVIKNDYYINKPWYFRGIPRHWKEYHCTCTKTMKVSYTILNNCIFILIWWYSHGVVKEYRYITIVHVQKHFGKKLHNFYNLQFRMYCGWFSIVFLW